MKLSPSTITQKAICYSIPIYQRLFEWDMDNVLTLLEDLKKSFDYQQEDYYIGMLTSTHSNELVDFIELYNKKTIFPSSFIEVTLAVTPNIEGEDGSLAYRFICTGLRGDSIEIPLKAILCGGAEVSVEKITFTDYLGIFSMKKKKLPEMCKVKILPRIPDTGSQSEVLRSVSQNLSFDDSAVISSSASLNSPRLWS